MFFHRQIDDLSFSGAPSRSTFSPARSTAEDSASSRRSKTLRWHAGSSPTSAFRRTAPRPVCPISAGFPGLVRFANRLNRKRCTANVRLAPHCMGWTAQRHLAKALARFLFELRHASADIPSSRRAMLGKDRPRPARGAVDPSAACAPRLIEAKCRTSGIERYVDFGC